VFNTNSSTNLSRTWFVWSLLRLQQKQIELTWNKGVVETKHLRLRG